MALFDGNLKQRLIGTVVLIVLAVVFLPMIFNNKGEKLPETIVTVPAEPQRPEITPQNQSNVVTTVTDNNQANTTVQTPQTTLPVTNDTQTPTPTQQPTTTTTTNIQTTTPATTQEPAKTNSITPSWTIQVAAVSNQKNAEIFTDKLRKANYNAYTRKDGNLYRIFVGPFIKKTEAFRVQKLIEKQFKEKGIVREFKPEAQ